MFGWEFPPNNQGGLGTACYGLTKGLHKNGVDVTFVLPKKNSNHDHVNIIVTDNLYIGNEKIKIKHVDSLLYGYATQEEYLDIPVFLTVGNTFGSYSQGVTEGGKSYKFTFNVLDSDKLEYAVFKSIAGERSFEILVNG